MPRKLLYLYNPISGTKNKPQLIKTINSETRKAGLAFEIMETRADGNYSDLSAYLDANLFTDVIICGGDGSVSTVTSYLLNSEIVVGIIPTGSGNGLALTARIPYSTRRALDIIFAGHSQFIDGFRFNGKFLCMMWGIGNDADIAHEFALTKVRGLKTYIRLSFNKYFSLKPYSFTIDTSGVKFDFQAFFISVSNSNQFGNYVTIAPRASLNDGLLDIVVVRTMNRLLLPFALFRQIAGINKLSGTDFTNNKGSIVYFQGKELKITNHDNASIHVDGEPHAPVRDISLSIVSNAFRLLQPYPQGRQAYR